jgi:hypothetical protein
MSTLRLWIFRVLVLMVAGVMLTSAILPWWEADIVLVVTPASGLTDFKVMLYQHGIPTTAGAEYFQTDVTPAPEVKLAWGYIALSTGLLLAGAFMKGKAGKWIVGATSATYIIYALVAVFWIARRTAVYGVPLMGETILIRQNGEIVTTGLQSGYYLALVSGLFGLVLAIFYDKVTGRSKSNI